MDFQWENKQAITKQSTKIVFKKCAMFCGKKHEFIQGQNICNDCCAKLREIADEIKVIGW